MKQKVTGKTVFVGMSGGVDSSVAALRLLRKGYTVVGVFIKVWHPNFMVCNWEQERLDAMRVAAHLKIPFLTCDAKDSYRDEVAQYFINEYASGRTPNPDVMCNQKIKFGAFIDFAKQHGADYIATGHYAQRKLQNGKTTLNRGVDRNKDQSYFLWSLTQKQLEYSLFPVGDTMKNGIRNEAAREGLPVAHKDDSQGICFLGHVDIPEFLSHYITLETGSVLSPSGKKIGRHQGALVYTLGQRHGFTIDTTDTTRTPLYVIDKDLDNNTITVSKQKPQLSPLEKISLEKVVLRDELHVYKNLSIQFRYRQTPIQAKIEEESGELNVLPEVPTTVPAAGQSCVIYADDVCVGGGIVR